VKRIFALLTLLASGCASEPARAPESASAPAAATKSTSPRPSQASTTEDEQAVVNAALAHVSAVRKLPAKGPVKSQVIGRSALLERVQKELLADLEPELIEGSNELLFSIGAAPADLDYLGSVLKLLGSQLAGFYDPRVKEMVLLDDLGPEAQEVTLWHELVHALQDQHYDLGKLVKWAPDRGDALGAIQALAEGDATSAMLDVMLLPRGTDALTLGDSALKSSLSMVEALPEIASVPAVLKRSVVAPYIDGVAFTHALRSAGGWAAVDAAWRDPPATTEQMLHPEKYRAREPAERLPTPVALAGGPDRLIYHDVLGEQSLRIVFEEWVPPTTAAEAASGWAGDAVAVFANGDRRAVAVHLRYDTEEQAIRGFEVLARGALTPEAKPKAERPELPVSREEGKKAAKSGRVCRERAQRGPFAVARTGRDLGVTLGPYQRRTGVATSDAGCPLALPWAEAIARAR
jgi:hypothetical protein